MTVLYWIKNAKPWKQYVMTRVKEICESTTQASWRHCPGVQNPADLPSRGLNASDLVDEKRWWKGPEFLFNPESEWPQGADIKETESSMEEVVKNPTTVTHTLTTPYLAAETDRFFLHANIGAIMNCNHYNSKTKLLRVTALVLRFVRRMKGQENAIGSTQLNAENLKEAENLWIRSIQSAAFSEEIQRLNTCHKDPNQLIKQLNLFLDVNQLIRCEGRLENSTMPTEAKNPILLPSKHHFTELIILEEHNRVHHNGIKETLNCIRESYWILRGRETVKRVLKGCVSCKKIEGKSFSSPREPSLPSSRVSDEPPFTNTGIDFAGPLLIKENEQIEKSYVCLFTCASTRAVHLELLKNLSTDMFLQAFRRFASRRGIPRKLISDNAKTFKAAAKEVVAISRAEKVQRHLTDQGVMWDFITEKAPWHGGFWERLIKSTKRCLKKSIGRTSLTFEELRTILVEIEATLNNRPLTYLYDDEQGISYPLTPEVDIWAYQTRVLKNFTDQWRKEYLLSIRESSRAQSSCSTAISVGDIVILKNESTPRIFWKLARVEILIRSKDDVVRSAKVKVLNKDNKRIIILRRPIQHLIPLEIRSEPEEPEEVKGLTQSDQEATRPKRNAAVLGELNRRKCY